jgi:hypothetical protein
MTANKTFYSINSQYNFLRIQNTLTESAVAKVWCKLPFDNLLYESRMPHEDGWNKLEVHNKNITQWL